MNTQEQNLLADIYMVGKEVSVGTGARAFAAWLGLQRGVEAIDDELFSYCEKCIGHGANQEGYLESDEAEVRDGELFLGYGMAFSSIETYLHLHRRFGLSWLEESLLAFAKQHQSTLEGAQQVARGWMTRAREGYDGAVGAALQLRLESASAEVAQVYSSIKQHNQLMSELDTYAI